MMGLSLGDDGLSLVSLGDGGLGLGDDGLSLVSLGDGGLGLVSLWDGGLSVS